MKSVSALALLSVLLAVPAAAQTAPATPTALAAAQPTTLQISATAEVKAAPDMATISAGVMTDDKNASTALSKNAQRMNEVLGALKAAGIEAKDIRTTGLTVNPQYIYADGQAPKVSGYQASNNVDVLIHKLDQLGSVIDALVAKGANQISGPNFGIDAPDALLDGARAEAISKARAHAEIYAKAAGLRIRRIQSISEGDISQPRPPMPMMRMMAAADSATPVAQGQLELAVSVTVTFELEQ